MLPKLLYGIDVSYHLINNDFLVNIRYIKNINLSNTKINNEHLVILLKNNNNIRNLNLSNCNYISDIEIIGKSLITDLNLTECKFITDFEALGQNQHLKNLTLSGCCISSIKGLCNIHTLNFNSSTNIFDAWSNISDSYLLSTGTVRNLYIKNSTIKDLNFIGPSINILEMIGSRIINPYFTNSSIVQLSLTYTSHFSIVEICKMKSLLYLNMTKCDFIDFNLLPTSNIKHLVLTSVIIDSILNVYMINQINQVTLINCRYNFTKRIVDNIFSAPNSKTIKLNFTEGWFKLNKFNLVKYNPNLKYLTIDNLPYPIMDVVNHQNTMRELKLKKIERFINY
jgi:hypothetical protein